MERKDNVMKRKMFIVLLTGVLLSVSACSNSSSTDASQSDNQINEQQKSDNDNQKNEKQDEQSKADQMEDDSDKKEIKQYRKINQQKLLFILAMMMQLHL